MQSIGRKLVDIHWIDMIIILMGVVLLTEFYTLLALGFFNPEQMTKRILLLSQHNNAGFFNVIFNWVGHYSRFFAPLFALIILLTSLMLILLIYRGIFSLIAAFIFLIYFIAHTAAPTTWLYEYIIPTLFSLAIGFARLPDLLFIDRQHRAMGFKAFSKTIIPVVRYILILVLAVLLGYIVAKSNNAGKLSNIVAIISSITFVILIVVSSLIDRYRLEHKKPAEKIIMKKMHHKFLFKLYEQPWLDIITIIIGSMLVFQIYEDKLLHWFTLQGYRNLANIYSHFTHAPLWMSFFLRWTGNYANIFLPIQLVIESTSALLLVILIFREPFILIAAGLFILLAVSELGVPAAWPATLFPEPTWTWELLLTTVVTVMVGIYQLGRLLLAKSHAERWLGNNVFGNSSFYTRVIVSLICGLLIAGAVIFNKEVEAYNHMLAIESGLTLFLYMMILSVVDYTRPSFKEILKTSPELQKNLATHLKKQKRKSN